MKAKIITWKEVRMLICDIFIIIIKITNDVMRFDAIELMFSLDFDQVFLKDLAMIMLRIKDILVQNVVNYNVANILNIIV